MLNEPLSPVSHTGKAITSVIDKFKDGLLAALPTHSLQGWAAYYYQVHVKGAPEKTEQAKQKDLAKFLNFFQREVGHDAIDS